MTRTTLLSRAPRAALVLVLVAGASACVFGFRGQINFAAEADLSGLETVRLQLPATDLVIVGDANRSFMDWSGTWTALGGSSSDALASARKAELRWESWEQIGRLAAVLPLETRDITSLDTLEVETASTLAHEVVGSGDVFIAGIDAYVSVDLDGGDVEIVGGNDQLIVTTLRGDIDLSTSAAVDATSGIGRVHVSSDLARDIVIETYGAVLVELADASDLDIDIDDAGEVRVELDTATHLGSGRYRRSIGAADTRLQIRAGGGRVLVRNLASGDATEP